MSRALEFSIPDDVSPAVEQMLLSTAFNTTELCERFAEINEERTALRGLGEPTPGSAVSSDEIIGADAIAELPLDHPERHTVLLFSKKEEKLDRREQDLKNSHDATMRKTAAELWEMQPALEGRTPDFIGMAAVLETVTPYEGDRQKVLTQASRVFEWMRWRVGLLQQGMPVVGFESLGTDQLTTFGGRVSEVAVRQGKHAQVLLDLALKGGKELSRALPPLIDPWDVNYLYYPGTEQEKFADNAYWRGLKLADIDRAIREARPQGS